MSYPIRVGMIVGKMIGGGVESVIMNYFRYIDRSRIQFDFIIDSDSTIVPREEIEELGGRVFTVPPYQNLLSYERSLKNLFEQENWKIVHSHINALSVIPLRIAEQVGVPIRIAHSHSTSGKGEYMKNVAKNILRTQANRFPTHRLACSKYAGEWLFGCNAEFDILYNAIDLKKYSFSENVRRQVREELGITDSQFVVGHLGRFMKQKNHEFLIKAFYELSKVQLNSILILVGDGELKPSIESLVAELGLMDRVLFLGQRDDAWRLYQAFDVFVLPSLYEGLGLVGIEAQRAGLPCLLSDEVPREVDVTGTCVFLSILSSGGWTESLLREENKFSCNSCSRCLGGDFSLYDINQAAKKLTNYYEHLLTKTHHSDI